jgi:hypothetical protein
MSNTSVNCIDFLANFLVRNNVGGGQERFNLLVSLSLRLYFFILPILNYASSSKTLLLNPKCNISSFLFAASRNVSNENKHIY